MARRAHTVTALIAAVLGLGLITPGAQAASATRTSSFVYDTASGLLVKEIIEPNDPQLCLVTEYQYDAFGNKTGITTRNCNGSTGEGAAPAAGSDGAIAARTSSSTYDARGQFAVSTTNALGHTETRTFDERFGAVKTLTGPNGLITSWTYDGFGRKTLETRADGTTTTWLYGMYGAGGAGYAPQPNLKWYVGTRNTGESRYTWVYYDTLNRKILTERRNLSDTDWIDEGNTYYDAWGRVSKVYQPYETAQFANAKATTFTYDILGRVVSETAPDGGITTKTYAGLTTTVKNPLNQTKTTLKNTQGQTLTITDAQNKTISYTYDPFGNLTQTTDALGNVTGLTYDARGRKVQMNDPDMGVWTYAYNALGELIRQVDAKAQTVTMQYDVLGRMTSRNEPDLISTWTYDTQTNGIGKLATATAGNGYSRTHTYDALGRLSSTSTVIDDPLNPYVTSTAYDANGRVDTQTYPASPAHPTGFTVKNIYNGLGYLTQVVDAATPATVLWAVNTMDAMGHVTQQTYGNGLVTQQIYNPVTGRLEQQLAGAGNAVQNMSYTYDTIGNLTTRSDANNNLVETYTYDTLNRVKTANSISGAVNVTNTYEYDAIGNITCKSDISACDAATPNYTYNASGANSIRPHAVAGITGTINGITNPTFTYDANGNMLNGAGRTITWTSFNIPSQIDNQTPNGLKTAAFLYNPEHERTKETQADGSIVLTLSPRYDTGLHFEKKLVAANGTLTGAVEYEHYLYAGGQMFGKYIVLTQADGVTVASVKTEYYSKDHLGSIVAITDGTGAVIQTLSYDVWGKRRYPNGTADPNGLLNNPDMYHGYTGHEMLDDVGLIHMNGRLYDPIMGRFISADFLIPDAADLQYYNRYTYVGNNPLAFTDASGQCPWCIGALIGAVVAGAQSNWDLGAMAKGAVLGAIGGGVYGAAGGGLTGSVVAGATVGGISAGINGGSIATGMIYGAVGGALTYGGGYFGSAFGEAGQFIGTGIGSGMANKLSGGDFGQGVAYSFLSQAIAMGYDRMVKGNSAGFSSRTQTQARLARGVYDPEFKGADGYNRTQSFFDKETGLQAGLFVKGSDYILAFAGTSPTSWANWKANFSQAFGFESAQYTQGIEIAVDVYSTYSANGTVSFTGHSLGGGIAAAAAAVTGGSATVFNAAGVNASTVSRYGASLAVAPVQYYYSSFDVLRIANAITPARVPGQGISLGAAGIHGMDGVCSAIGC